MLVIAITSMLIFATVWFIFAIISYTLIYGSLVWAYLFIWDDATRKSVCPKGLWHTVIFDE